MRLTQNFHDQLHALPKEHLQCRLSGVGARGAAVGRARLVEGEGDLDPVVPRGGVLDGRDRSAKVVRATSSCRCYTEEGPGSWPKKIEVGRLKWSVSSLMLIYVDHRRSARRAQ